MNADATSGADPTSGAGKTGGFHPKSDLAATGHLKDYEVSTTSKTGPVVEIRPSSTSLEVQGQMPPAKTVPQLGKELNEVYHETGGKILSVKRGIALNKLLSNLCFIAGLATAFFIVAGTVPNSLIVGVAITAVVLMLSAIYYQSKSSNQNKELIFIVLNRLNPEKFSNANKKDVLKYKKEDFEDAIKSHLTAEFQKKENNKQVSQDALNHVTHEIIKLIFKQDG